MWYFLFFIAGILLCLVLVWIWSRKNGGGGLGKY